jgi:D-alanyl-D-alanine carboxypeptidase/D-alanyl-D-alanine-endopeptidase (penicillin-binding protein 4)
MATNAAGALRRRVRALVAASAALTALLAAPHAAADRLPPGSGAGGSRPALTPVYALSAADLRIATALTSRASTTTFGSAFSGVVLDAQSDRVVWSKNPTTARIPASNTKLVTALNALTLFGPDRRFTTTVRQGTSRDRVVLVGAGDPSLSSAQLDALAKTTASTLLGRGIRTVRIYVDDDVFPRTFTLATGWLADYVPGDFTPLHGLVRDQRDVANTTTDAGAYFRDRLKAYGLSAGLYGYQNTSSSSALLASSTGLPLSTTVNAMLLDSDNEIAEALHRLVGIAEKQGNTWSGARTAQAQVITSQGLSIGALYDGSGLSRSDRLTAMQLARAMDRGVDPSFAGLWPLRSSAGMPTAGQTGTLQAKYGRFATTASKCAAGKVWGKTGSLPDVTALTGYTTGADGRVKVFSFLVNSKSNTLTLRQALDMLAATVNGCY